MNCYYHPFDPAVAPCVDCGKGLCYRCAHKYTIPICDECNQKRKSKSTASYLTPLIACAMLFVMGYLLDFMQGEPVLCGYLCMSIYGGWKALDRFLPIVLVWLNLESIFWFFVFKLFFAMLLGVFITPFYLIYCLYKLICTIRS